MKRYALLLITLLLAFPGKAQNYDSLAAVYIGRFKGIAVEEMERAKIPASITLAQGLLETGFGQSVLMKNTNNHFGIKCHETWTGKTFRYTDDAPNECFRVYDNPDQSYRDHSDFLRNRPRYAKLFTLDINDYKAWAYGLKEAGYATNPKYPDLLIKYIETYQLYRYDDPDYLEQEWLTQENVVVQDEIFVDKTKHSDDDVKVDTKINYPTTSSVVKTGPKKIYTVNKCKAVKMAAGEDLEVIALKTDVDAEDLVVYNDLLPGQVIPVGQYVYLQPKKKKGIEPTYKMKSTDNMWAIAQNKGLQLPALLSRNHLVRGEEPEKGQVVYLSGKAPEKPKLRAAELPALTQEKQAIRDTTYPTLPVTYKTSVDSANTPMKWEDGSKLAAGAQIKPYPIKDSVVLFDLADTENLATMQHVKQASFPQQPAAKAIQHTVVKGDTMYGISKRYGVSPEQIRQWNQMPDNNVKLGQVLLINP